MDIDDETHLGIAAQALLQESCKLGFAKRNMMVVVVALPVLVVCALGTGLDAFPQEIQ